MYLLIFSTKMKNELKPIFNVKQLIDGWASFFPFGTENWEEQLKTPCILVMVVSNHFIENKFIFYIFHISCIGFIVCYSLLDFLELHV